jgi:predicted nucleic acid-binding protein
LNGVERQLCCDALWSLVAVISRQRSNRSLWGDTVAKVVLHWWSEILRAADATLKMWGASSPHVHVLQEFYVQATRSTRPDPLPNDIAAGLIRTWLRFKVQEISAPIMTGVLEIKAAHRLSYWDAAIVAAARAPGCQELYSEDMSHGREIEGVTIINAFR